MRPAVFEPGILASERPQTHALDGAATGIGRTLLLRSYEVQEVIRKATSEPKCVVYLVPKIHQFEVLAAR